MSGWAPGTHKVVRKHLQLQFQGSDIFLLTSLGTSHTRATHIIMYGEHSYTLKKTLKRNYFTFILLLRQTRIGVG